jgi:poly-beta-1,6-N-acetyl-D-glucosamine synthase
MVFFYTFLTSVQVMDEGGRAVMGSHANAQPRLPGRIVALIPAHDEETSIERTLASLRAQTLRPDRIIVIADNCADSTARLGRAAGEQVMTMRATAGRPCACYLGRALADPEVLVGSGIRHMNR